MVIHDLSCLGVTSVSLHQMDSTVYEIYPSGKQLKVHDDPNGVHGIPKHPLSLLVK